MITEKYRSDTKTALVGDRVMTIEHLTPILSPEEYSERKRGIEQQLFRVFSKYTDKRPR